MSVSQKHLQTWKAIELAEQIATQVAAEHLGVMPDNMPMSEKELVEGCFAMGQTIAKLSYALAGGIVSELEIHLPVETPDCEKAFVDEIEDPIVDNSEDSPKLGSVVRFVNPNKKDEE
jgi:hypothetical protein